MSRLTFILIAAVLVNSARAQYLFSVVNGQSLGVKVSYRLDSVGQGTDGSYRLHISWSTSGGPGGGCQSSDGGYDNIIVVSHGACQSGCQATIVDTPSWMPCYSGAVQTWTVNLTPINPAAGQASATPQSFTILRDDTQPIGGVNAYISLALAGTAHSGVASFTGHLQAGAHSKPHRLQLQYNGHFVAEGTTPANAGNPTSATVTLSVPQATDGDSYQWFLDGVGQGAGVVQTTNVGTNEEPLYTFAEGINVSPVGGDYVAPTPPPQTTPYPSASPPPIASGSATPATITQSISGGGSVNSAAVTVVNPQDIYNPIVDAIGKLNQPQRAASDNAPAHDDVDLSERGHIDDLQGQLDDYMNKSDSAVAAGQQAIQGVTDSFQTLPTSLGSVGSLNIGWHRLGVFSFAGRSMDMGLPDFVDLTPYQGFIAIARQVELWVLTIAFGYMTIRALGENGG